MNLFALLADAVPSLLRGTAYTLLFAFGAMFGGLLIGFLVAAIRIAKVPLLQWVAVFYVSAIRGTPLLVQIFVIYYGLPSVGIEFGPITAGILSLSLNVGAYMSETLRGALVAVDRGQWEGSFSLGMSYGPTLLKVIIPQALRIAVPSLSNSLIGLLKDTSLVSVISVTGLMWATKEVVATTFQPLALYLGAAAIYWALSLVLERVQHWFERRLALPTR